MLKKAYTKLKYLYRALRYKNRIDPCEIDFLLKNLEPGNIAVDIGAHKGGYLYWMQKAVMSKGKVFAFEPQQQLYNYLIDLKRIFNFEQVEIFDFAISDVTKYKQLYIHPERVTTGASLVEGVFDENKTSIIVQCKSLDDFFEKGKYQNFKPTFIKVDVESHELEVLEGANNILKTSRPIVQFEAEQRVYRDRPIEKIFDYLNNLKFAGYFFFKNKLTPIGEFNQEIHQPRSFLGSPNVTNYANNFIFIPEERLDQIKPVLNKNC